MGMKFFMLLVVLFFSSANLCAQIAPIPNDLLEYKTGRSENEVIISTCDKIKFYESCEADAKEIVGSWLVTTHKCQYYKVFEQTIQKDRICFSGGIFPNYRALVYFTPENYIRYNSRSEALQAYEIMAEADRAEKQKIEEEKRIKYAKEQEIINKEKQEKKLRDARAAVLQQQNEQERYKKFLADNSDCQIVIKNLYWGIDKKYYEAEGTVTNLTNIPLKRLKVLVEWNSKENIALGTGISNIDYSTILSGQTAPFSVRQKGANPEAKFIKVFILDDNDKQLKSCFYK